jgi:hypothetical protein
MAKSGRKPFLPPNKERVSFWVPSLIKARAEARARKLGVKLSDVMRDLLDRFGHSK